MASIDFKDVLLTQTGSSTLDPKSPWYVYAATTIEGAGEPTCKAIRPLWQYITSQVSKDEELIVCARRMREGLLKSSVLVGFPRGINSLLVLHNSIRESHPQIADKLEKDRSKREDLSAEQLNKRGESFFDRVYSTKAEKVKASMSKTSGGDLDQFAILSVYGELMGDESILNAKETGLMEFLACYAGGAAPQANGHMYGSKNLGNTKQEIQTGVKVVKALIKVLNPNFDFEDVDKIAEKMDTKWK